MKTETKAQLKNRIAELELRIAQVHDSEHKKRVELVKERMKAEMIAINAKLFAGVMFAYATALTIWVVV